MESGSGSTPAGKPSRKKNLIEIMAAHEIPYAATATAGFLPDLVRKVEKAKALRGMRLLVLLVPCLDGWGVPEDQGIKLARLAVESGVFPLYVERNVLARAALEKTVALAQYASTHARDTVRDSVPPIE